MCAGPYALRLLGISPFDSGRIEQELLQKEGWGESLRPGFARVSLPYFASEGEVDFVARAVGMVARAGWRLLPDYRFNPKTGEWKARAAPEERTPNAHHAASLIIQSITRYQSTT